MEIFSRIRIRVYCLNPEYFFLLIWNRFFYKKLRRPDENPDQVFCHISWGLWKKLYSSNEYWNFFNKRGKIGPNVSYFLNFEQNIMCVWWVWGRGEYRTPPQTYILNCPRNRQFHPGKAIDCTHNNVDCLCHREEIDKHSFTKTSSRNKRNCFFISWFIYIIWAWLVNDFKV